MIKITAIIYDLVFAAGLILFLPLHLVRGKINLCALAQKLGFYPLSVRRRLESGSGFVWIQAVSVGEVRLIKNLVREIDFVLKQKVIISTTTLTGKKVADKLYPQAVTVYFPFDLSFVLSRSIRIFKPLLFISVETEIWPNLYYRLKKKKVPVLILNGRISDRAFSRYRKILFLLKKIFALVDFVGVQDQSYLSRFLQLGLPPEKIAVTGNLKLSRVECSALTREKVKTRLYPLLKGENEILLVAASTHRGEEEMILEAYREIKDSGNKMNLILAPRHIERIEELQSLCKNKGLPGARLSRSEEKNGSGVYLLDTVGDLVLFFTFADICFVGGSLVDCGGHNILEPMSFGLPTVFGPYMSNFREIEKKALEHKAALKVKDAGQLRETLSRLVNDPDLGRSLARSGADLFREGEQVLKTNLNIVKQWLK